MHAIFHRIEQTRPVLDIAAIFRTYGDEFRSRVRCSFEQTRVMDAILRCRTAALGGHLYTCSNADCDHTVPAYNSCRNRHCPKCQGSARARWIEARKERLLNTSYFHVVFTLPKELRGIAKCNQAKLYGLLLSTAADTLLDLGRDPKYLGALVGVTAILHTWTRTLAYHPHAHCIVTGGGLALDGARWVKGRSNFLFPVKVLGKLFAGKFLAGLKALRDTGGLKLASCDDFDALLRDLYRVNWVVYAKRPFGGPEQVFSYVGQYTHRVGIASSRLRSIGDDAITFDTKNGKTTTLHPLEFIRRFLQHVLPRRFVKIRHFGLHASQNAKTKLKTAMQILGPLVDVGVKEEQGRSTVESSSEPPSDAERMERIAADLQNGLSVVCPKCRTGLLRVAPKETGPP